MVRLSTLCELNVKPSHLKCRLSQILIPEIRSARGTTGIHIEAARRYLLAFGVLSECPNGSAALR
jgi:hypothetical protein